MTLYRRLGILLSHRLTQAVSRRKRAEAALHSSRIESNLTRQGIQSHPETKECTLGTLTDAVAVEKLRANLRLVFPPPNLCTDNGAMIAWAGIEKLSMGMSDNPRECHLKSRWPIGNLVATNEDLSETTSLFKETSSYKNAAKG